MWYNAYGWQENPFYIRSDTTLFGIDEKKQELLGYILSGDICFLNGPTGIGKSSLLKWVEENLEDHSMLYIDAAGVDPKFSITTFLKKSNSFWNKLAGKWYPKNVVILLDESQDCDHELVKALKLHWDHGHIKSIVIAQINPTLDRFTESFRNRVGNRVVKLDKLTLSNAYDLITHRTGGKNPFDKAAVEAIVKESKFVPRKILETCEIVCAKYAGKKLGINVFDVEEVVNGYQVKVRIPDSNNVSPMQKKIMQHLKESDKTTLELAKLIQSSEGSVGKQLSKLMQAGQVIITQHRRPKRYGLQ